VRRVCRVEERVQETPSTVTLRFDDPPMARPGQFVMLWIPGDDEIPMSLSYAEGDRKGATVKAMGGTSQHVLRIRTGDRIGIRGPYGVGFDVSPRRILVVAGGSGAAVLAPATEAALAGGGSAVVALGATTASDDGSAGARGFVTPVADALLRERPFDVLWTCGPEVMMEKLVASAARYQVPVRLALERHMKCALGLCDACSIGPYHVCIDGPVFPAERIAGLPEFGRFQRDASGRRIGRGGPVTGPRTV
jgi:dihydroorotate dehydrogenase electron transfer subunit